jgi:hypothetical protein
VVGWTKFIRHDIASIAGVGRECVSLRLRNQDGAEDDLMPMGVFKKAHAKDKGFVTNAERSPANSVVQLRVGARSQHADCTASL